MTTKPERTGLIRRLLREDSGATAIEYAMIAVGISVAASALIFSAGTSLNVNFYQKVLAAF
ncbi:Flp family type IVb pilin [Hansschlegelia quercus]|uniref:Flp family type IVb pilin n=1 Tax=Hansschlegelia quercus TaxID=2528245 RepID=A0A4Q9GLN6_9HYPH|nr:Flp family type IVb pilin [Hansschlegelia quercus]TBN53975.1 Flp family type IVb pilin [Hansschlegelia quercus]